MKQRIMIGAIILMAYLNLGATNSLGEENKFSQFTLAGLKGVYLIVNEISLAIEREGLTKNLLKRAIKLKLRQADIRVLTEEELLFMPGKPCLYLSMHAVKNSEFSFYAYWTSLELRQLVRLERDKNIKVFAITWSVRSIGMLNVKELSKIRESVRELVDRFINAYFSVNPR